MGSLEPGDTLTLKPGDYRQGLPIHDIHGTSDRRIRIVGPSEGRAVLHGQRGRNVVSIVDSAYVTIRGLEIDGGGLPVDGVKAEGHSRFAHHITLRDLVIRNLAPHQQVVGISAMCPTWGWVIRGNVIRGAGTGMYLGKPDGSAPFVAGLIERNLVVDSIGYNLQIKHQSERPQLIGMESGPHRTIIRHNVFAKGDNSSRGDQARPNVLLGDFPPEGPGSDDLYAVYGNVLYRNPSERLFQGEGNVALYDNLLVNLEGNALAIMPHKAQPRRIWIFHNTVVARGTGLYLDRTEATGDQLVTGNAVFAERPLSGDFDRTGRNVTASFREAAQRLAAPFAEPGRLDLSPRIGSLLLDVSLPERVRRRLPDVERDFAGEVRSGRYAGAYAGPGAPSWRPDLERKP